jgi:hypothetical protein
MPKTVISQDVKALIASVGPNRCNIFMIQNNNTESDDQKDFWKLFKNLPEPRWKSLKLLLVQELLKKIPYSNQRALFVGISERTMRAWEREVAKDDTLFVPVGPADRNTGGLLNAGSNLKDE